MEANLVAGVISLLVVTSLVAWWFGSSVSVYLDRVPLAAAAVSADKLPVLRSILDAVCWYRRVGVGTGILVGCAIGGGPTLMAWPLCVGLAAGSILAAVRVRARYDFDELPAWVDDLISQRVTVDPAVIAGIAIFLVAIDGGVVGWLLTAWAAERNINLGLRTRPIFATESHTPEPVH